MNLKNSREIFHKVLSIISGKDVLDCLSALSTVVEILIEKVPMETRDIVLNGILYCITKDSKFVKSKKYIEKESDEIKEEIIRLSKIADISNQSISKNILDSLEELNLPEYIKEKITFNIKKDFVDVTH